MFVPTLNLGIPQLITEWRTMFSKRYLLQDLIAGLTVACVAIPLSLAIALASGVAPEVGLVTAIVAGITCALFGSVPLAVSGPAAAMAVIVASVVQDHGIAGLLFVGFGCGILQLATGMLGLGTLIRFVPVPVVMGFTAGIGAIILIGQFPRILGLPAPSESDILSVLVHIKELIHHTQPTALILSLSTLAIIYVIPKIRSRLPGPLVAVTIPSLVVYFLHIPVATVGTIPNSLPAPLLPHFPSSDALGGLISETLIIYALASLETLLSAGVVDRLAKTKPHNPNQELIGQGLGNIGVSFFGGIPITAVIARSALNVQSGAKTRRSSIFHALALLFIVYYLAPVISHIPIAVLAGLLISIALRMCHPHEFLMLWHSDRSDAAVYLVTFIMIVALGLLNGIEIGIAFALVLAAIRSNQIKISIQTNKAGPTQLMLEGSLSFLSASQLDALQKKFEKMDFPHGIIFDLTHVKAMDASGASHLIDLASQLEERKIKIALYGVDVFAKKLLIATKNEVASFIINDEADMENIFGTPDQQEMFDRLAYGIKQFKQNLNPKHKALFSGLAKVQKPHTLFITCSDSRIDPNLITSTQPGELFIVRNIGNIIPKAGDDETPAEGAAIEFAVQVLGVNRIIVCGHSECGAMQQVLSDEIFTPERTKELPNVAKWLFLLNDVKKHFFINTTKEEAAKINASLQLENVKTYPIVRKKLAEKSLKLQAWYYNIGEAELECWDEVLNRYVSIVEIKDTIFGANDIRGLFDSNKISV